MKKQEERYIEFEERRKFLEKRGWDWSFPEQEPRVKRRLFADESSQMMRPTVRREA